MMVVLVVDESDGPLPRPPIMISQSEQQHNNSRSRLRLVFALSFFSVFDVFMIVRPLLRMSDVYNLYPV